MTPALFVYHTLQNHTTKLDLFYLMYRREDIVPLNLQMQQRKEIPEASYDRNIKTIEFKIGDQVLMYELAKENVHSDKLKEKWKGPYYIHDYSIPGTYKLRTIDGKILKKLINTN